MSEKLITAQEVIDLAIPSTKVRTGFIKDAIIDIAQQDFIYPVLGEYYQTEKADNIYNMITETPYADLAAKYKTLITDYIKPALAFYIKYLIVPDIFAQITNVGVQQNDTENSHSVTAKDKDMLRSQAKKNAETLMAKLTRYLNNSDDFPEYSSATNKFNTISHKGGLIFKRRNPR